jgi:succinate dehydrogenase / fumarate reductase cytochrome b subunit
MNKNNKPLSPHLSIYKPQITSIMSISHRLSGIFQSVGNVMIFIFFLLILTGEKYYNLSMFFLNSYLGRVFTFLYIFSLCYHMCNGIRHLVWDLGYGFELKNVYYSGYATIVTAVILNAMVWIL